ncbi:unnamed protein product [Linum tenue]|uniref:CG-1 domain-containing protein n=2 Tax=Linum tenue TaxID=586396 RepID=A0AAV0KET2_9ROSI|nr:unnamed protein product [Linum tenue]
MAASLAGDHLGWNESIHQILLEAQNRWLRPAEICEILRNHDKFRIAPEPQNRPPSGSLFLFDRKVLRYFRKDGHNWRKKRDGKTVKEAHERLKSGSIDVLHCYYAHGEGNENFQRRTYWMLEEEQSRIVLVHYREVKQGTSRASFYRVKDTAEAISHSPNTDNGVGQNSEMDTSVSSNYHSNSYQMPTQTTEDTISMASGKASEYEDVESVYNHPACSGFDAIFQGQQSNPCLNVSCSGDNTGKLPAVSSSFAQIGELKDVSGTGSEFEPRSRVALSSWDFGNSSYGIEHLPNDFPSPIQADIVPINPRQGDMLLGNLFLSSFGKRQESATHVEIQEQWQKVPDAHHRVMPEKESGHGSFMKHHMLDVSVVEDSLKKLDSFNRWMSKELGDVVNESPAQSTSATYWQSVESEDGIENSSVLSQSHLDPYLMTPSLANDQLFTIVDFSPNWAYVGTEVKVLITGRFLKSQEDLENCKWSCMFGEVEVPAEIIADGVLRCYNPLLKAGRIPFYITCSNRIACSEVREFEFRVSIVHDVGPADTNNTTENLEMRFEKLLCLSPVSPPKLDASTLGENEISQLSSKLILLLKEEGDEWDLMVRSISEAQFSAQKVKDQLLQKLLKDKLHDWLLQKVTEGGKGASVLDEGGQGVLHLAAALGFDWALEPTIVSGVRVDFRDVNGWTALHWAACCGRERTVASLLHLGAAPGALTDPTPGNPTSRTPADLASANGHKGIAGFLAESALTSHFTTLALDKQQGGNNGVPIGSAANNVQPVPGPWATPDDNKGQSLKESLDALSNATQAAARIHQVFRLQSFQRKQLKERGGGKLRISDEEALSFIKVKGTNKKPDEPVQAAAVRIQNKFRSWKGRREFLVIRQQIVKIQALVRGHQVRKNYKKIIWSVGIVEKVILRWRRKRSGLRGFKPDSLTEGQSISVQQHSSPREDDYDFFKEGRKQTEERSKIALARVKSMVQYPEARDQYHRLRNVVTEIKETKSAQSSEAARSDFDDLVDLESLLDEDIFMPTV